MRRSATLFVALALFGTSTAEGSSTEDKKKAIRMKSTPKLKEILTDLGIEHDASIEKEELRELVLQKDALTKWEKKHPGQKKAPSKARAASGGGGGGGGGAMGDMFFTMMDKDKDGQLSKEEVAGLGDMMAGMGGAGGAGAAAGLGEKPPAMSSEQADQFFTMMDGNGDGIASKAEVSAFMDQMMGMMGKSGASSPLGGGPGGMMGGGMPGGMGGGMGSATGGGAGVEDEDDGRDEL